MKHETPTIKANRRERVGSRYAQRLRKSGRLPAVIYGHQTDPVAIEVDEKETLGFLQHGTHVMNVQIDGSGTETCLVKELQFGYLGDNVIHIDFARVNLDEEVSVSVHLHFVGQLKDSTKPGAIVTHGMTQLEVVCKVTDIPDEIKVDLSKFVDAIHVRDIELPANVRAADDEDALVAHVSFMKEEEAEGEAAEVAGGAAEPELIKPVKPEEEEGGEE